MSRGTLDVAELMNDAIRHIVRQAIEKSIGERMGAGIEGDFKAAIKAEAASIMQEPEMQAAIRARLRHWIGNAD